MEAQRRAPSEGPKGCGTSGRVNSDEDAAQVVFRPRLRDSPNGLSPLNRFSPNDSSRFRICLQPGQASMSVRLQSSRYSGLLFSLETISESALLLDLYVSCANFKWLGRTFFVGVWRAKHAAPSSRMGRLKIAHRFSRGVNAP